MKANLLYSIFLFSVLTLMPLSTGCGDSSSFKTEMVSGVVTLDGTPVEGATVTFHPVNEGQGNSAVGKTDATGTYKLTVVGNTGELKPAPDGGTTPGEYEVKITKFEQEVLLTEEEAEEQGAEYKAPTYKEPEITYIVPKKYKEFSSSDLKATVKEGTNDIPFDLTN